MFVVSATVTGSENNPRFTLKSGASVKPFTTGGRFGAPGVATAMYPTGASPPVTCLVNSNSGTSSRSELEEL